MPVLKTGSVEPVFCYAVRPYQSSSTLYRSFLYCTSPLLRFIVYKLYIFFSIANNFVSVPCKSFKVYYPLFSKPINFCFRPASRTLTNKSTSSFSSLSPVDSGIVACWLTHPILSRVDMKQRWQTPVKRTWMARETLSIRFVANTFCDEPTMQDFQLRNSYYFILISVLGRPPAHWQTSRQALSHPSPQSTAESYV